MILSLAKICVSRGIWKVSGTEKYKNKKRIIISATRTRSLEVFVFFYLVLSPGDGHWGKWYGWSKCPEGSYAQAFRLRFEPRQLFDDSGLNAVEIQCNDIFGNQTR